MEINIKEQNFEALIVFVKITAKKKLTETIDGVNSKFVNRFKSVQSDELGHLGVKAGSILAFVGRRRGRFLSCSDAAFFAQVPLAC